MRQELSATVGSIIAGHRTAQGLTQEQLSLALDVDPMTISRFERGVSLPSLTTIHKLCNIFGISLSQFFSKDTVLLSSNRQTESAALISMLDNLQEDDRKFIVGTIKRFCRLATRKHRQ